MLLVRIVGDGACEVPRRVPGPQLVLNKDQKSPTQEKTSCAFIEQGNGERKISEARELFGNVGSIE
jgi:hypothetical protein